MAYSAEELKPIKPRTLGEVRRLAHALMYPDNLEGNHYVIMSRNSPMHFVAGVFEAKRDKGDKKDTVEKANKRALDEAVAAMEAGRVRRGGIERDLEDPYEDPKEPMKNPFSVYEVEKTGAESIMEWIEVCWHDDYTEWWCPWMFEKINDLKGLTAEMVDHFELTIVLNDRRGHRASRIVLENIASNTDLITIRREAMERFVYPQYATSVDSKYAAALRERMKVCHPNKDK